LKVVIDTNIFVSSFFGGKPKKIIELWSKGEIIICVSPSILDEYFDVLTRAGLKNKKNTDEILALFSHGFNSLYISKTPHLQIIKDDPDDDKFIECAIALNSNIIISGDKHLLHIKKYLNIEVYSPHAFLDTFFK